jgi:copper chaperone CopZ
MTLRATAFATAIAVMGFSVLGACQSKPGSVEPGSVEPSAAAAEVEDETFQTAELMVEGTNCASCAVPIRRHLHKLPGIGDIREGSTKKHLLVQFDPALVTTEQLVKAVTDAGFDAQVWVHSAGATSVREHGG